MKIFYTVTITGNQHESHERATDNAPLNCCDEMYNAWGDSIAFDPERKVVDFQFFHASTSDTEFRGGDCLRFCPWCGEPIELEYSETKDKRVTACAAELKGTSRYTEGMAGFCHNSPRSGRAYCGCHKHLEEVEPCGGTVVSEVVTDIPLERTCECDPATLVHIVISPVAGVQCTCGAVWPVAKEPEVKA